LCGIDFYVWIVDGPDTGSMQLPALPAEAGASLNPTAADTVSVAAFDYKADTVTGYDAIRSQLGHAIGYIYTAPHPAAQLVQSNHSETPDD